MIITTNTMEEMNNLNNEKKKNLVLILFYATWCGHCQAMEPEWEKLQNDHPEDITLAKVESSNINNYNLSPNEERIMGYPTIRLYDRDEKVMEFDGERNFETMYKFIEEYLKEHPNTNVSNMLLLRGKKTNKHNSKLLEKLRTNKKIKKLSVKKFGRNNKPKKDKKKTSTKSKSNSNLKKKNSKKRGRPKGSKNKPKTK